jgi:DNA polymerase-3 subunit gamma/tau
MTDTVALVLGLVGRDVLLDIAETVANEDGARVFDLTGRIVESGQDLKLVMRELTRLVRDMLLLAIDPSRASDPDFAPEGDVARLSDLTGRFSREDLLRAFDLLQKSEFDVRTASQPRYAMEMALLKWIHLRKLTPIEEVIASLGPGRPVMPPGGGAPPAGPGGRPASPAAVRRPVATPVPRPASAPATAPCRWLAAVSAVAGACPRCRVPATGKGSRPVVRPPARPASGPGAAPQAGAGRRRFPRRRAGGGAPVSSTLNVPAKLLDEVRKRKKGFHMMALAQARRVDVDERAITFVFSAIHKVSVEQVEANRAFLEALVVELGGRPMAVKTDVLKDGSADGAGDEQREQMKARALAENAVQGLLDVFPGEILDVQEGK